MVRLNRRIGDFDDFAAAAQQPQNCQLARSHLRCRIRREVICDPQFMATEGC
jgi:hypothetical protein